MLSNFNLNIESRKTSIHDFRENGSCVSHIFCPLFQVPDTESDTKVLLELLKCCSSDSEITSLLAQIQGPWSFIYLQVLVYWSIHTFDSSYCDNFFFIQEKIEFKL